MTPKHLIERTASMVDKYGTITINEAGCFFFGFAVDGSDDWKKEVLEWAANKICEGLSIKNPKDEMLAEAVLQLVKMQRDKERYRAMAYKYRKELARSWHGIRKVTPS